MKKVMKITLSALMFAGFFGFIDAAVVTSQDIASKSSMDVYNVINGLGIQTFSTDKSYVQVGLEKFDQWTSVLEAAGGYFSTQKNIDPTYYNPKDPNSYLLKLQSITAWLNQTIKDIQQGTITSSKRAQIQTSLENQLKDTDKIINYAFNKIVEDKSTGPQFTAWVSNLKGKTSADVFPNLDTFLKDYLDAKSRDIQVAKGLLGYEDPQIYYEYRQGVINKYEKTGKYQIDNVLEKLREVIYIEEQKWIKGDLSNLKAVFRDINAQFPGKLYPYTSAKFSDTKDKASIIILGIAQALDGALLHLHKDLAPKK